MGRSGLSDQTGRRSRSNVFRRRDFSRVQKEQVGTRKELRTWHHDKIHLSKFPQKVRVYLLLDVGDLPKRGGWGVVSPRGTRQRRAPDQQRAPCEAVALGAVSSQTRRRAEPRRPRFSEPDVCLRSSGWRQTSSSRPSHVAEFERVPASRAKTRVERRLRSEPEQSFAVIAQRRRVGVPTAVQV